ncbi:MAG: PorP/SprF family type IX secretion system membrane protein [Bacteroidota bacterium]
MMKKILSISILLLAGLYVQGQQLPLYSQYLMNTYYLNPAVAGSKENPPVKLSVHKQWLGINDSPSTQALSGHMMLENDVVGLGGIIFNDDFGPTSHTGIIASYAYHFNIDRLNKVSLGLSAIGFQYKMDERFFTLTNPDDDAITYNIEKTFVPDATAGAFAYGPNYTAGISVAHLFQSKLKINQNLDENVMARHYFLFGSYLFEFDNTPMIDIEPSILVKTIETVSPQIDINVKFYYDTDYWAAFSVRPNDAFIAAIGMKINNYYFGYAYDFTFSDLSSYTIGSQEIVFGINVGEKVKSSRSFF